MSQPEYFQPELFLIAPITPEIELLDGSSLATVLTMMTVAETADELDILEMLTEPQQTQVLTALPKEVKQKLCQWYPPLADRFPLQDYPEPTFPTSEAIVAITPSQSPAEPDLVVGDRVVLKAKPQLTTVELLAIFEVVAVQEGWVKVRADRLGSRRYAVEWLVLYGRGGREE
ncbi:MAG: hypothetical protein KME16_25255 [Scytolyngbya sp. HA4215-MV1]|jgi:hypothetical protein|nr:hypothetical protein [Scytolyngbya sp. HA4215-MV1]